MSDTSSVARPYSHAVFELARDAGDFDGWSNQLECIAEVSADTSIHALLSSPQVSREQLAALIIEICADQLDADGANLVRLLSRNGRLDATAAIAEQYAGKRAEAEKVIEAELVTASEVSDEQKQVFSQALEKRLGRSVKLDYSVEQDLIGGAVVRAGDWVVDGSVRAQLEKLVGALGV